MLNMSPRRIMAFAALALGLALSACASDNIGGQRGVWAGNGPDPMAMVKLTKSDWDPRNGKNPMLAAQYLAVQDLAKRLKMQLDWQTSSNGEACASEGLPYFVAGAVGGGTEVAFAPPAALATATVTGVTYGLGGCINGAITHSYDGAYAMADALEKAMRDAENDAKEYMVVTGKNDKGEDITVSLFHNVHAHASFVNSGNRLDKPAPDFAKAIDWHGDTVGAPAKP